MDRSYALKIETRSFVPYYHDGYPTREQAEKAMAMFELKEGWVCSVVYVERKPNLKGYDKRQQYSYVELPDEG